MPDFVDTRLDCFRYTEIGIRVKNKLLRIFLNVILSKELFQYLFFKKKSLLLHRKNLLRETKCNSAVFDTRSTLTQCYTNSSSM